MFGLSRHAEDTCLATGAKKPTRGDYALASPEAAAMVKRFNVEWSESFATHAVLQVWVKPLGEEERLQNIQNRPSIAQVLSEKVEAEIQDSHDHLEWIDNRLATIAAKLVQLNVTRCEANQLFIQQLKEHQDALDAIAILRTELDRTEAAREPCGPIPETAVAAVLVAVVLTPERLTWPAS